MGLVCLQRQFLPGHEACFTGPSLMVSKCQIPERSWRKDLNGPTFMNAFWFGGKCHELGKGLVKKYGGGGPEQRGGGSWGVEPCARGGSCNFQLPLRGWVTLFFTNYKQDSWLLSLYKTKPTGIIAKILTNLLCEKIQRLTGRTSVQAWNPLWTVFLLFCKEMIGGSLKIYWNYCWFCVRFHFFIQASFIVDTEGWYYYPLKIFHLFGSPSWKSSDTKIIGIKK